LSDPKKGSRGFLVSRPGKRFTDLYFLRGTLDWRKDKLFLISDIFQCHYAWCPRRNVPEFGRVFLMLKYTDITQNTYVQSGAVTEIMAREV